MERVINQKLSHVDAITDVGRIGVVCGDVDLRFQIFKCCTSLQETVGCCYRSDDVRIRIVDSYGRRPSSNSFYSKTDMYERIERYPDDEYRPSKEPHALGGEG